MRALSLLLRGHGSHAVSSVDTREGGAILDETIIF